jgi:salicylate hydroxylase
VHDGKTARVLADLPLGDWIAARHGAPYWAHRGDLAATLLAAASADPRIELRPGFAFASLVETRDGVEATSTGGETMAGAALIGADGLWSQVRQAICPGVSPQFTGATATRAVVPAAEAGAVPTSVVGLWLTPGVHVVHYPVRAGAEIAVVVIAAEDWRGRDWDGRRTKRLLLSSAVHREPADARSRASCLAQMGVARPAPRCLPGRGPCHLEMPPTRCCPTSRRAACWPWRTRSCWPIAWHIRRWGKRPPRLETDAACAPSRCRRPAGASRIYHLSPPFSWARDAVLRLAPGPWLMAGYDWLYGWRTDQAR